MDKQLSKVSHENDLRGGGGVTSVLAGRLASTDTLIKFDNSLTYMSFFIAFNEILVHYHSTFKARIFTNRIFDKCKS